MPATRRHIELVPNLGTPVVVGHSPTAGHEAWLVDPSATPEQIVKACAQYLEIDNARCEQAQTAGQRRALWLLLAMLCGFLAPSPLRPLFVTHGWLSHATHIVAVGAIVCLLALALHEHRVLRRLLKR